MFSSILPNAPKYWASVRGLCDFDLFCKQLNISKQKILEQNLQNNIYPMVPSWVICFYWIEINQKISKMKKKNTEKRNAIFKWIMYSQIFCSHYWWNVAISWTLVFVEYEVKEECNRSLISWQWIREMQMMKLHLG